MNEQAHRGTIGFACAYTPLPIIDAAGFVPHRILPLSEAPDQAGSLLHDSLCPHIKRVLDRALSDDLPELAGAAFMNSCDAMRRLADAWQDARPAEHLAIVDLPFSHDAGAIGYFAEELERFRDTLADWAGAPIDDTAITASIRRYHELALVLAAVQQRATQGTLEGGSGALQGLYNRSVTRPLDETLAEAQRMLDAPAAQPAGGAVPLYLFGNVLADPAAFDLFESCGVRIVGDDLCTGSRQLTAEVFDASGPPIEQLARSLLSRPACARTITAERPGDLGVQVLAAARECGATGVVAHVMKFCDPYLGRLPQVREVLDEGEMPMLVLEGDCTLRSLGQQQTRIEAFVEMLGGDPS